MPDTHTHSQQIMSSVGDFRFYQNKTYDPKGKVRITGYLWSHKPRKILTIVMGKDGKIALKTQSFQNFEQKLVTGIWSDFDDKDSVREHVFKAAWDELEVPIQLCLSLHMGPLRPDLTNEEVLLTIGYAPDLDQEAIEGACGWKMWSADDIRFLGWGQVDASTMQALQLFYGPMALLGEGMPDSPLGQLGFVVNHVESQGYVLPMTFYAMTLEGRDQYDFEQGRALHDKVCKAVREVTPCK